MHKAHSHIAVFTFLLLCIACQPQTVPPEKGGFWYKGIYFAKSPTARYKMGVKDGCRTAQGFYTKNHHLFNEFDDYNEGWFKGRNKCRKLLKLDENGDLIDTEKR